MDYPKSTPGVGLVDGKFVDENPTLGQIGSLIPASWGNAVTKEILNVIESAGMAPAEGDLSQLLRAIQTISATDAKRSVRCATTGPIALSGLQNIDGVSMLAGDRVLVKNQASAAQNWIYTVAAGAWVRALDANESAECIPGHLVPVQGGTVNGGTSWQLTNLVPPTLGTTALNFSQALGRTGVVAGEYTKVKVGVDGRVLSASSPDTLAAMGIKNGLEIGQVGLAAVVAPRLDDFKAVVPAGFYQAYGEKVAAPFTPTPNGPPGTPGVLLGVIACSPRADMTAYVVMGYTGFVWFGFYGKDDATVKWTSALTSQDLAVINTALATKASLASPALTGVPTTPTPVAGANNTQIANTAFVKATIDAVIGAAPGALDTLVELAKALGNDPNFATTITNALAGKQPLDATLTALAALSFVPNRMIYSTGPDQFALAPLSDYMRGLFAAADHAQARQTLGAAATSHTHAMADITGLAAALNAARGLNQGSTNIDPDAAVEQVILTNHARTPNAASYWHITTTFYSTISATSNRGQIAVQYNGGSAVYARSSYQNVWTEWTQLDNNTPPGTVVYFPGANPPPGFIKANGALLNRTTYAALFAAIGVIGGAGDGRTTFNVPDLRGEFIRALDDGRGVDPGRLLGSVQTSQNASHTHNATISVSGEHTHSVVGTAAEGGSHTHNLARAQNNSVGSLSNRVTTAQGDGGTAISTAVSGGAHVHAVSGTAAVAGGHSHSATILASGGNETRPRSVALLACIKY
ncbi:tail fiber protein [Pseudomonas sp. V1]|uniref:tail fiber protein n=1 Tax=Pseudomonas arcuscaelestis TaxID=2710591 RepID=UPI001F2BDDF2|nr:tail fiber protein [Pseudomonas arcuscaelestis]MBM3106199.1 tail fiber protein [Pseudomonas arcuscaelestis]